MASKDLHLEEIPILILDDIETIRANHDEAFLYISQGLSYEEIDSFNLACDMYNKGLQKIEKALNVRCDKEHCVGQKWDECRKMQQKMRKVRQQIQSQIQNISSKQSSDVLYLPPEPNELPPPYSEISDYNSVSTYQHPSDINQNAVPWEIHSNGSQQLDEFSRKKRSTEVVERYCIPAGVLLFFVPSDGSVSTSISTTSLHIYQFLDESSNKVGLENSPPAWLQVGSWTYPLIPNQSPSLESAYGAFMFPDLNSEQEGSYVGIIFPSNVSSSKRAEFENILAELTVFEEEKNSTGHSPTAFGSTSSDVQLNSEHINSFSDSLSRGIVIGAEYLSAGLVKGAALTSDLIHKGASKMRQHMHPEEKPVAIDPRVKDGLKLAKDASGVALKASSYLVQKLGEMTVSLARQLAPHVHNQGSKFLTHAFNKDPQEAKETLDGVLTVAAGGLAGFSTVYMGLEKAARTLAVSLSSETVNIVDHKYGVEAGEVAGNAVYAVGNLALATHNVQALGVKSIAKRTAKDTGKAVLNDYVKKVDNQ